MDFFSSHLVIKLSKLECIDVRAHRGDGALKSEIQRTTLQLLHLRDFAVYCGTVLLCCSLLVGPLVASESHSGNALTLPIIEGRGIEFHRLPADAGLSQTRVSDIVQDNDGFIWFGTQNGLNRFDGYKCKVFRHDPQRPDSLSGVYIHALFKDRSGNIWVASDQFLDRLDPVTESFTHYSLGEPDRNGVTTTISHISQDSSGFLWLSTNVGLFRLDAATKQFARFVHDPQDSTTIGDSDVSSTGEDREGRFWVATSQTLDEFDRGTGKVIRHISTPHSGFGNYFHEDRFGVFWIFYGDYGVPGILDRTSGQITRFQFGPNPHGDMTRNRIYAMLEDRNGNMWFGSSDNGLLEFDREHRRFVSYGNRLGDSDSLADNRVTTLFEDRAGTIWVGLHQAEPNFFTTKRPFFEKFTHESGNPNSLDASLVSALYEDRNALLWVGSDHGVTLINRSTGKYSRIKSIAHTGSTVLSIVEQEPDILWLGTDRGIKRYERNTGNVKEYPYPAGAAYACIQSIVESLLLDKDGTLWGATWEGLCHFNPVTQSFTRFKPESNGGGLNYHAIVRDKDGNLWLGSEIGLHRFDPLTSRFTIYSHRPDDPHSLSDNRVNSVYIDHAGTVWAGTQNGLDKLDRRTSSFSVYGEQQGMSGNVVSCVLEDRKGSLWMSTNKGISNFDPRTESFRNYTVADGLPGDDLTGWGACYKSSTGEMFFGGFSGAVAFFPDRITDDTFVPPLVLTDFKLFGDSVTLGKHSLLTRSIGHTDKVTLSHAQNAFAIEFSALSYLNAETERYRYRLENLESKWNEVDSNQRMAAYTALPYGTYMFRVEATTSHGHWSEPGISLRIQILPPWWSTWWFRSLFVLLIMALLAGIYQLRIRQLREEERHLRNVVETIPAMAFSARPDGTTEFVNRPWLDYTGLEEKINLSSGWESSLYPEDRDQHARKWHASLKTGAPFENEERHRNANNQYRWFLARCVPLRDSRGNVLKWYGTLTDIEDRKRSEEERERIRQLQAELAHINRVTTMGELTASLAHEIRQPITAAANYALSCCRWLSRAQPDHEQAREAASKVIENLKSTDNIISRIRALFHKGLPHRTEVDVNEVIQEMIVLLRKAASQHSISISTQTSGDLPRVMADRVQLQQVFMNLMLNGIEAMKGISQPGELTIRSQTENGELVFSVSDTGIGLPAEDIGRIFRAFYTTKPEGTGMGLAISRSIVEAHGGRLWASANPIAGATFHFTLKTDIESST